MFKKSRRVFSAICIFCTLALSSCGSKNPDITPIDSTPDMTFSSVRTTSAEPNISETINETAALTASPNDIQGLIDEVKFPQIDINENSTSEEIIQSGKTAAKFYAESAEKYFEYGVERLWKLSYDDGDILENCESKPYQTAGIYRKSLGLYAGAADAYVPMNGRESKQFLIDYLGLTETGYEELCENSPSTYTINGDSFYVSSGDGGQAGWSYSRIVDYAIDDTQGKKTVTYNCERIGDAEEWGYDEDLIQPFTFRLALENDIWKLDGVSYGEGFFEFRWLD